MHRVLLLLPAIVLFHWSSWGQCITAYPHNQPFTSGTEGTPGTLPTNWTNLTGDNLDWNVDRNGTNGSELIATGPFTDRTLNNTTTNAKYMYVESAGAGNTPNKTAILESPCFNISSLSSPYLTFWYHMRGAQMGSLIVDINANGAVTQNHWTMSGDQGLYWRQGWLNLAPWAGQTNLRIRFRAITGTGELSDIAIDDVFIGNLTPVFGCNESTAANYSSSVNVNNGTCSYSCPGGQKRVRIDIFHDSYPGETSWTLKNGSTDATLASGTTSSSICVPSNTCLVFRINDSVGDGIWHNSYGYGQYFLWLDGALVKQGGPFGSFEETTFNCAPGFSCSSALPLTLAPLTGTYPQTLATVTTSFLEQWYDFTPPQSGQYQITTCGSNTCDTRLWVYDMNCSSIVLSSGVEGATFADDNDGGCGLQAVINANMPGGTLHHLRVGHNAASGGCGNTVTVSIIYMGPVVGCMNTQSCNYNPLATVPCANCCLPFGNPACPVGPDLVMNQARLQSTLTLQSVNITDNCAPVEGCVRALGQRYVLRFATRIDNIGTTDYYIGSPGSQPQMFSFNNCHGHAHYAGYADYILFDQSGNAIPVGFKNGFCVIDVGCFGGTGQYGCSNMGISKQCYDEYGTGTTCNWIDITDVPNGTYTLVLRTNWQHAPDALGRHEMNYANNYAQVCINITRNAQNVPSFTQVGNCPTWTDCLGQAYGDARLDCNGVCNGPTKRGDLNSDGQQAQGDAMEYVQRIMGNDISPNSCNDLNADSRISVTDAALMVNAYTQQAVHSGSPHVLHYHPWFDFPRGWLSVDDQVDLSLGNLDPIAKTVDVLIRNPSCRVMGYEFNMSGITIQSATNLASNLAGDISINTTLGGTKVIGISYLDTSLVKNTGFVPLLRINYLTLTAATICISSIDDIVNKDANNVMTGIVNGCLSVPNTVAVRPQVWLEGPFEATQPPLMRDDLRVGSFLPLSEPYTGLGYSHVNGGGAEQIGQGVLAVTGSNAIVDYVVVEARNSTPPHAVLATRTALLQRDGDVVGMDGSSPVLLQVAPGNYRLAIRHRNHLGVMTGNALPLGTNPLSVDLRAGETATYGTGARKNEDGTWKLWAGNALRDNKLQYVGDGNDRDPILVVIGGNVPTATVSGYYLEDVNLSGVVKYTGASNDRDPILVNIGGSVPTATRAEQLP
ncbi:MAG: hypothetical protein IPM46_06370 [Flavobacteriales bacterium]|nr:hypothetical protein [Flavobacteriales bacterium]